MLKLGPELLIYQAAAVKAEFAAALGGLPADADLDVDASALEELDGAGLQLLVVLAHELSRRGGRLQLQAVSADLRRRIADCGLAEALSLPAGEVA